MSEERGKGGRMRVDRFSGNPVKIPMEAEERTDADADADVAEDIAADIACLWRG